MCPTCRRKLLVSDLREAPRVVKNILEKFLQQNKVSERRDGPTFQVITYPVYAMFGTFRTRMETIEFNSEAINLTKIESNKQTLWYNIMVPFVHIQELLYCNSSDNSINLLFIKPTLELCEKIEKSLNLALKFDIRSTVSIKNYIIVVFREKITDKLIDVKKLSKKLNANINIKEIDVDPFHELIKHAVMNRYTLPATKMSHW